MILVLLFLVGAAMAIGPWIVQALEPKAINWSGATIISVCGLGLLVIVATIVMFTRLYRRAAANVDFILRISVGKIADGS